VKPLKAGARGRRVAELKGRLEAWYAEHAPEEWERFRVNPGPLFGARVDRLVRDFQGRVGLGVDGVAGEKTFAALSENRRPKR
jgi:murein L,D-transpeptidase YcbB/YkuD